MNHIELAIQELKERQQRLAVVIEALEELTTLPTAAKHKPTSIMDAINQVRKTVPKRARVAKPTMKPAPVNHAATASATTLPLDRPETFGSAMKKEIALLGKFTRAELLAALESKYPDQLKLVASPEQSTHANLSYWHANGKLDKTGQGALASYTIRDHDFFPS